MKHRTIATLTIAALLSACTQLSKQPQTLDQKLHQAQAPDERREVLRLGCLNEAEYTTDLKKAAHQKKYGSKRLEFVKDTEETRKLKSLCREMTDVTADDQKAALAGECRKEVEAGLKSKPEYKQHYDAMQDICMKMTVKIGRR